MSPAIFIDPPPIQDPQGDQRAARIEYKRIWHQKNKVRLAAKSKEYRTKHADELAEKKRLYYEANKERLIAYSRERHRRPETKELVRRWEEKNADKVRGYARKRAAKLYKEKRSWRHRNLERCREWSRNNYASNPELRARSYAYQKKYRKENKDKVYGWHKAKLQSRPSYRILTRLRSRMVKIMSAIGLKKDRKTVDLIGCSIDELKEHLQSLFTNGMTWENYGKGKDKWQVDHVRPCSSFNMTDEFHRLECFHYSNLQPLWATDNARKNARKPLGR